MLVRRGGGKRLPGGDRDGGLDPRAGAPRDGKRDGYKLKAGNKYFASIGDTLATADYASPKGKST